MQEAASSIMSNFPVSIGYVMSNSQLNHLWHYDMYLAHVLMDLPLRTCSMDPVDLAAFPAMNTSDFEALKKEVRAMWIFASHHFFCKQGPHGWGLYFSRDGDTNPKPFSANKPSVMGWLAKAPAVTECPTGHRYLRSPCDNDTKDIYLGGPISLANFDELSRVICKRCISINEPRRFKIAVSKAPGKKITAGQEVLWTYSLDAASRRAPRFYDMSEWHQDCCKEVETPVDPVQRVTVCQVTEPPSEPQDSVPVKKRKMGGPKPKTSVRCVDNFRFCTYCGLNLASDLAAGKKDNMKRHWALKHAVDLCREMGVPVNEEDSPVSEKEFLMHLDKVTNVFNSLRDHSYTIVPACNFFDITGTPLLNSEASDSDKKRIFDAFIEEGASSFQKYQVLYLKGIKVPENYDDLLKPGRYTNYSDVNWKETSPPTNNFSINNCQLNEEENAEHALEIKSQLTNVVLAWKDLKRPFM